MSEWAVTFDLVDALAFVGLVFVVALIVVFGLMLLIDATGQ